MSVDFQIMSPFVPQASEGLLSSSTFASPVFRAEKQKPRLQRIALTQKITGKLGSDDAILIDISLSGVLVAHQNRLPEGAFVPLQFDWKGDTVNVECEVMRVEGHRPAISPGTTTFYRSGLVFRRQTQTSMDILKVMMTDLVERALDERRANARGVPPIAGSFVSTGRNRGYLMLRYIHGVWQRVQTGDAVQPVDGFTVSIDDDPSQIKLLCDTYEKLSGEDRKLVQKMAALSISNPAGTPARRYEP